MRDRPFTCPRSAALALLNSDEDFSRKTGGFLGQLCGEPLLDLSEKQVKWLQDLLAKGGFPPLLS